MSGNQSISHTKWNCKYHIVFAPKYRRQLIYSKLKEDIGKYYDSFATKRKWKFMKQMRVKTMFTC